MIKSHVSKQNIMRNIKITSLHEFGTFLIPLNSFYTIKKNHCFVEMSNFHKNSFIPNYVGGEAYDYWKYVQNR